VFCFGTKTVGFCNLKKTGVFLMAVEINRDKCCYCGACVGVCPALALELFETRVECDAKKCIDCGSCIKMCPVAAISRGKGFGQKRLKK